MSVNPPLHITRWPDGKWSAWSASLGKIAKGDTPESCLAWLLDFDQPTQHGKELDNVT